MKRKTTKKQKEFAFLAALQTPSLAEEIQGWRAIAKLQLDQWRGEHLLPPDTLLFHAVEAFRAGTDFPLELPFLTTMHYVAGLLLVRGVALRVDDTTVVEPMIWSVGLCQSGGGKSTTLNFLRKAFNSEHEIEIPLEGVTGARSFFDAVERRPQGLWVNDEFGQRIRVLSDTKNADWKALVLRLGTGDDLLYSTGKDGEMAVRQPRVSLLGLTQTELWTKHVPPESLLDGLCARCNYLIARDDPSRPPQHFPRYKFSTNRLGEHWKYLANSLLKNYTVSQEALAYYDAYFAQNWPSDLPRAFARRLMFSAHRYALLYHVICNPELAEVSVADYVFSMRLVRLFLHDGRELLGEHNLSELEKILNAAERACERFLSAGKSFAIRDLISSVRSISNTMVAQGVWRILWPTALNFVIHPSTEKTAA